MTLRFCTIGTVLLAVLWSCTPAGAKQFDQYQNWQRADFWGGPRTAKPRKVHRRSAHRHRTHQPRRAGLVTVPTAAGVRITVSPSFARKIVPFIADLAARGYKPKRISCWARGGHVRGSRHYSGNACDFDQRAWGRTAPAMYKVASLARKHGLRDGGSFSDYGHIDDGRRLARARGPIYARLGIFVHVPSRIAMKALQ